MAGNIVINPAALYQVHKRLETLRLIRQSCFIPECILGILGICAYDRLIQKLTLDLTEEKITPELVDMHKT